MNHTWSLANNTTNGSLVIYLYGMSEYLSDMAVIKNSRHSCGLYRVDLRLMFMTLRRIDYYLTSHSNNLILIP